MKICNLRWSDEAPPHLYIEVAKMDSAIAKNKELMRKVWNIRTEVENIVHRWRLGVASEEGITCYS